MKNLLLVISIGCLLFSTSCHNSKNQYRKKFKTKHDSTFKRITHGSPDQNKLDSIKDKKLKNKFNDTLKN